MPTYGVGDRVLTKKVTDMGESTQNYEATVIKIDRGDIVTPCTLTVQFKDGTQQTVPLYYVQCLVESAGETVVPEATRIMIAEREKFMARVAEFHSRKDKVAAVKAAAVRVESANTEISAWTIEDVNRWVTLRLPMLSEIIAKRKWTGKDLLTMNDSKLKEYGFKITYLREAILKAIDKLKDDKINKKGTSAKSSGTWDGINREAQRGDGINRSSDHYRRSRSRGRSDSRRRSPSKSRSKSRAKSRSRSRSRSKSRRRSRSRSYDDRRRRRRRRSRSYDRRRSRSYSDEEGYRSSDAHVWK